MKHFLDTLRKRYTHRLQKQSQNTRATPEDVARLKELQQRLQDANTLSEMMVVMQDNSWSLQKTLFEVLIAADPGINTETMDRILSESAWDL
jgi:hypothetical protein